MQDLKIGDLAPDFTLPTDSEGEIALSSLKGKWIVLYFYPKDDTSGCTKEAIAFKDLKNEFENLNAQILGISKDSPSKHDTFKDKYDLNFPLISDEETRACQAYGAWVEKSMYGRKYMGIDRSTFLIDPDQKIVQIWRKVKVPGHAEAVLDTLKQSKDTKAA